MLLFEGGKSLDIDDAVAASGIQGVKRILSYLDMLDPKHIIEVPKSPTIYIDKSSWVRAQCSGLLHDHGCIGRYVSKGGLLAVITDPFGQFERKVNAPNDGYIINANLSPIVYQGDAVYHISKTLSDET
jgi:hypothetical protein